MNTKRTNRAMTEITKVVAPTEVGFLVVYYLGDRQIASESYDLNGVLVYCSGSVPDGVVRRYYGDGTVKEQTEFRNGSAHGKNTKYYPEEEAFEKARTNGE